MSDKKVAEFLKESRTFMDLPEWAADAVHLDTDVHFNWQDRIRILAGWTPNLHYAIACEVPPGRTNPYASRVGMLRPKWWPFKPKMVGYMAIERPAGDGQTNG